MVAAAVGVASVAASVYSSDQQRKAGNQAKDAQSAAADAGVEESRRQFDLIQQRAEPYLALGNQGIAGQQALLGLSGTAAQQQAIDAIKSSPQFASLQQQGNDAILANASATGGLRGGNTQGALAQFSPALLNQLIDQQYNRFAGLTSIGQNASAMVGNAGMQTGQSVSNLLQQQGAAQAGGYLSAGRSQATLANGIANAAGAYFGGSGGFGAVGGLGSLFSSGAAATPTSQYALPSTGVRFGG